MVLQTGTYWFPTRTMVDPYRASEGARKFQGSGQCLELLLFLVSEDSFMSWKVVLWVIIGINTLNRFGLLPTYLVLLQINLCITIMIIMTIRCEGTLVSFLCVNALWENDAQVFW